ncbi:EF-P lysine aminoacylase EpmA [Acidomonas methanolica]|uniref:Lysyl-tRNA synthetase n=1 Tax=Acidomonas methanolica NBRC 104435 TaxID=1231351 RepID=A0A023D6W3_ACIMT|nr:EF-P lysine aminoacylase EpmA [Acidomonas methanolica]MBU2655208.1 EF-P lysine aminoacylase GenX [Acidomonas methanolica]TCS25622.1 lysyl-tRNA synthetase class 2 [Acidomonas methanolica]GAJ29546.1 lysyl-tRNA synthetase [Acidomonas methanolica NBRC 104435]GBQ51372.1 lysyl-tRNA synthetase [Acidomonas methanolica]GEK98746.1 EF-P lysine aminoacylase GenX [Acidomonas methanolica NBRC 104435]
MTDSSWTGAPLGDRLPLLHRRAALLRGVRGFFDARGYVEVETPYVVPSPGEEVHLRCFRTELERPDGGKETRFLHTSPEFAMKRIVAATGLRVFQMARVWRNGEASALHAPEFTMLEWYRPGAGLADLMDETEALLRALLPPKLDRREGELSIAAPFERLTMAEAFARHVGVDLLAIGEDAAALAAASGTRLRAGETWEDLFFRLLLERIEPRIGRDRPCFLTHWPSAQAALARRDPADPRVALRFELYAGGIELANAFEELTDPVEQRARFEADRARRMTLHPDQNWSLDEAFLSELGAMPPCSGIALGFDRLVLLAVGAARLSDIVWLS